MPDSPLYNGQIKSIGPRYCPSIETKIVTFADKSQHQLFLEPEGEDTQEYYLNGFSSSLPLSVQLGALQAIPAFRDVQIYRPGYAIEYDFFDPTQLNHTLETKRIKNLFFAGQINGTTGYEEAAGQGLMAGINAHINCHGGNPFLLGRDEAYIGVLIDDLVTKGVDEPYRMFTSRAAPLGHGCKLYDLVLRPQLDLMKLSDLIPALKEELDKVPASRKEEIIEASEILIKYSGYIKREQMIADKISRLESIRIKGKFDYSSIQSLSTEARQKLERIDPETIAQASRIPGISPSDINILLVLLGR